MTEVFEEEIPGELEIPEQAYLTREQAEQDDTIDIDETE